MNATYADNSIILQVPSTIPFGKITAANKNILSVTTNGGTVNYSFPIAPNTTLTGASNEFANPGDSVTLIGTGLFKVQSVTFPGNLTVTSFGAPDTSGIKITVPVPANLTLGGPITITTAYGTAVSTFSFNDTTGMKCDFDNFNNQNAWDNQISTAADQTAMPGGRGKFGVFQFATCPAGDWGSWQTGRSITTETVAWVPAANVSDPVGYWAIKFEMFIVNPWTSGCIFVQDGKWGSTERFEPWKWSPAVNTTTGWTTFTFPLSNILTKTNNVDGTGTPYATVSQLLTPDGNPPYAPIYIAYDNPLVVQNNFYAGIDNIRVVYVGPKITKK
jgi:hypothetical protein